MTAGDSRHEGDTEMMLDLAAAGWQPGDPCPDDLSGSHRPLPVTGHAVGLRRPNLQKHFCHPDHDQCDVQEE